MSSKPASAPTKLLTTSARALWLSVALAWASLAWATGPVQITDSNGGFVYTENSSVEATAAGTNATLTFWDAAYGASAAITWDGTTLTVFGVPFPFSGGTTTDNAIARWDGTTGTALQNSGVTISDTNEMAGLASVSVDSGEVELGRYGVGVGVYSFSGSDAIFVDEADNNGLYVSAMGGPAAQIKSDTAASGIFQSYGSANINSTLVSKQAAGQATSVKGLDIQDSTGASLASFDYAGNLNVTGTADVDNGITVGGAGSEFTGTVFFRDVAQFDTYIDVGTIRDLSSNDRIVLDALSPNISLTGDTTLTSNENGDATLAVSNPNTGTSARAISSWASDSATANILATSNAYTGVSGWNDSAIVSASSDASNGLRLYAGNGIFLENSPGNPVAKLEGNLLSTTNGFTAGDTAGDAHSFTGSFTLDEGDITSYGIDGNNHNWFKQYHFGDNAAYRSIYAIHRARGTQASPTTVASGDQLGTILWYGHDGTAYDVSSGLYVEVDGTVSSSIIPSKFRFLTTNSSGSFGERMSISAAGNVTMQHDLEVVGDVTLSGNDWCSVYNASTQAITNGSYQVAQFNSEYNDVGGMHSTSINNSRVTIQQDGTYSIHYKIFWPASAAGYRATAIIINGGVTPSSRFVGYEVENPPGALDFAMSGSGIIDLSAGDYVEVVVYQNSGGTLYISSIYNYRMNEFQVARIR